MSELYSMFQTRPSVRKFELPRVVLPSPDKVIRAVRRGADSVLIPVDAAISLVLRYHMQSAVPLEELQALVAAERNEASELVH